MNWRDSLFWRRPPITDAEGARRLHRRARRPSSCRRASTSIPAPGPATTPRCCSRRGVPRRPRAIALERLSARTRHGRRARRRRAASACGRPGAPARGWLTPSFSRSSTAIRRPPQLSHEAWRDARSRARRRLQSIGLHPPKRVKDIPEPYARTYWDLMPIDKEVRSGRFPHHAQLPDGHDVQHPRRADESVGACRRSPHCLDRSRQPPRAEPARACRLSRRAARPKNAKRLWPPVREVSEAPHPPVALRQGFSGPSGACESGHVSTIARDYCKTPMRRSPSLLPLQARLDGQRAAVVGNGFLAPAQRLVDVAARVESQRRIGLDLQRASASARRLGRLCRS